MFIFPHTFLSSMLRWGLNSHTQKQRIINYLSYKNARYKCFVVHKFHFPLTNGPFYFSFNEYSPLRYLFNSSLRFSAIFLLFFFLLKTFRRFSAVTSAPGNFFICSFLKAFCNFYLLQHHQNYFLPPSFLYQYQPLSHKRFWRLISNYVLFVNQKSCFHTNIFMRK